MKKIKGIWTVEVRKKRGRFLGQIHAESKVEAKRQLDEILKNYELEAGEVEFFRIVIEVAEYGSTEEIDIYKNKIKTNWNNSDIEVEKSELLKTYKYKKSAIRFAEKKAEFYNAEIAKSWCSA